MYFFENLYVTPESKKELIEHLQNNEHLVVTVSVIEGGVGGHETEARVIFYKSDDKGVIVERGKGGLYFLLEEQK